ncbi:hypothetical protein AVEN_66898-1 [Araneus ventricosus]|uniref:Uncharacterized protein n=1 Tax=Araneus ventricosus TaxID=182803 RepID=A0A4Y2V5L6_ARAVE|nr:hypothetical protein AVEN_66898-1 [Araneus ventricosus]
MLNIAGKHTKEILEEFSHEDSSSSLNESSSPTQNKEFYSTEDETVGEFNKFEIKICTEKFTGDFKKDDQKVLNVEGKHRKEILEGFSYEDSTSSLNVILLQLRIRNFIQLRIKQWMNLINLLKLK